MKNSYAEIELHMSRTIDYLASVINAQSDKDYGSLYIQMLSALEAQMQKHNAYTAPTDHIVSEQTILHIQDKNTGHVYCRTLPLDYHENSNGITLTGENLDGQETKIAFLSDTALNKMKELIGQGPDCSPCQHEETLV